MIAEVHNNYIGIVVLSKEVIGITEEAGEDIMHQPAETVAQTVIDTLMYKIPDYVLKIRQSGKELPFNPEDGIKMDFVCAGNGNVVVFVTPSGGSRQLGTPRAFIYNYDNNTILKEHDIVSGKLKLELSILNAFRERYEELLAEGAFDRSEGEIEEYEEDDDDLDDGYDDGFDEDDVNPGSFEVDSYDTGLDEETRAWYIVAGTLEEIVAYATAYKNLIKKHLTRSALYKKGGVNGEYQLQLFITAPAITVRELVFKVFDYAKNLDQHDGKILIEDNAFDSIFLM